MSAAEDVAEVLAALARADGTRVLYITNARVGHAEPGALHQWCIDCETSGVCHAVGFLFATADP